MKRNNEEETENTTQNETESENKKQKIDVAELKKDEEKDVDVKKEIENEVKEEIKDEKKEEKKEETKDEKKEEIKKKKKVRCILVIAYCGEDYSGLQHNPGTKTIESELMEALFKAGGIAEYNKDYQKLGWNRSCRTDKGVHAAGNVVSMKLDYDVDLGDRANTFLPPQIRILGLFRSLQHFESKNAVDYRVYEYMMPSYCFTPILKGGQFGAKIDNEMLEKVRSLFKLYEGSHNFHNFTLKQDFKDPSSNRFIREITVSDPYELDGIEFLRITLKGQSFMLHQIRKMISMVVMVVRYSPNATENILLNALGPQKLSILLAPAEFLMLERAAFNSYNRKLETLGSQLSPIDIVGMTEREEFKRKYIYPSFLKVEKEKALVKTYLSHIDMMKIKTEKEMFNDVYVWLKKANVLYDDTVAMMKKEEEKKKTKNEKKNNPDWN